MKLIAVDNFDRDYVADVLIASDLSEEEATRRAEHHNDAMHDMDQWYFLVKPDDYVLHVPYYYG